MRSRSPRFAGHSLYNVALIPSQHRTMSKEPRETWKGCQSMTKPKPFAFVLMPFGDEFDDIYRLGIQETAKEQGVVAERVDEQIYTESILERIYRQIDAADFVIADMTGKNPNVFYEVGYAHAKEKICTLITQKAQPARSCEIGQISEHL